MAAEISVCRQKRICDAFLCALSERGRRQWHSPALGDCVRAVTKRNLLAGGGQQHSLSTSLSIHCLPRRASFGPHGKPVYRPSRQRTTRSTMPRACVGMDGVPCCFSTSSAGRPAQPSPNHLQCLFCGDLARLEDVLNGPGGKPLVLRMLCAAELVFSFKPLLL